jgi:SOS-response transcriptional repressor LexA
MTGPHAHVTLTGKVTIPPGTRTTLSPDAYMVLVVGNGLAPRFCDGDALFVDPAVRIEPGRYVVQWPADGHGEPLVRQIAEDGERGGIAAATARMHVVVSCYRPE